MLHDLFRSLVGVSLSTGAVIALLLLLTPFLTKTTRSRWRCLVWVLLALRLLLPVQLAPPSAAPLEICFPAQSAVQAPLADPAPASGREASPFPIQEKPDPSPILSPLEILSLVWATGALGFLGWQGMAYLRFRRRLFRWQVPQGDPQAEALLKDLAQEAGLSSAPSLLVSCAAPSPMTLGLFRPLVVLPPQAYTREELTFILRHELAHRAGGHLWAKLLFLLARAVHWFNPLVHWMARQGEADLEQACDDRVMQNASPAQRMVYAQTILSALEAATAKAPPLSTQLQGGMPAMKARFRNLLTPAPRRQGRGLPAAALAAALLMSSLVACSSAPQVQLPAEGNYSPEDVSLLTVSARPAVLLRDTALTNPFSLASLSYSYEAGGDLSQPEFFLQLTHQPRQTLKKNDLVFLVGTVGDHYQVKVADLEGHLLEGTLPQSAVSEAPDRLAQANLVFVPSDVACYPGRPGTLDPTSSFFYAGFAAVMSREDGWAQLEFSGGASPAWVRADSLSPQDLAPERVRTLDLNQFL